MLLVYKGLLNFFTDKERAEVGRANAALFEKEVRNFAAGKESSLEEMYKASKELNIPFEESVNFQSAPDINLDKYWDKLDAGSKQQLWQIYEDPEKMKIALKRLKDKYGE